LKSWSRVSDAYRGMRRLHVLSGESIGEPNQLALFDKAENPRPDAGQSATR
jgi:hypothetical protein